MKTIKIARVVSDIFIPITFSAFMSFYLSYNLTDNSTKFWENFFLTLVSTVLLPLVYFLKQYKKGKIINRDAVVKEERTDVYRFTLIIFSIAYSISLWIHSPVFIQIYLLNLVLSTAGVYFINKKFKISIHSMTSAGTATLLFFIEPYLAFLVLILTFVIMWSRWELKVHTLDEVIAGMIYGFSVTLIIIISVLTYAT